MIIIIISVFLSIFVILLIRKRSYTTSIKKVISIIPPSIKSSQSYFFVKTKYRNISFEQCLRTGDYICNAIKKTGRWEECQEIYDIWVTGRRNGVFIDIGANIGSCSFLFACLGIKTISFEPLPNNLFLFTITTFTNPKFKKLITIYPYALGNIEKYEQIYINVDNWGASTTVHNSERKAEFVEKVHMMKLDQFDKLIASNISMIKIDVEGRENDVIEGGELFFKTHKAEYMYIEVLCGEKYKNNTYEIDKLYSLLNRIGYEIINKVDCTKHRIYNIIAKYK